MRFAAGRTTEITHDPPRSLSQRCLVGFAAEKLLQNRGKLQRSGRQGTEMRFADWKAGMNVCLSTRRGAGVDKCAELGGLSTRMQDSVEGAP